MLGEDEGNETDAQLLTTKQFDPNRTSATIAVVEAISLLERLDPKDLRPLLTDVIDADALNNICDSIGNEAVVEFIYTSYRVLVDSKGEIQIYEADA